MKPYQWIQIALRVFTVALVLSGTVYLSGRAQAVPIQWLVNGDFEAPSPSNTPPNWRWHQTASNGQPTFALDKAEVHGGTLSAKISAAQPTNAAWSQWVRLYPHTTYRLSGWIKTENVLPSAADGTVGAHLAFGAGTAHSVSLFGTTEWTYVSVDYRTGHSNEKMRIGAQLGGAGAPTTGTAWFDDLQLTFILEGDGPFRMETGYRGTVTIGSVERGGWEVIFEGYRYGIDWIDALALLDDGSLLLNLHPNSRNQVPGIGFVADQDIFRFFPDRERGRFERYFDGSDVGLETAREDIDALEVLPDGSLLISTRGNFSVPGPNGEITGGDEDILRFQPTTAGRMTEGTWSIYVDGSDLGLNAPDEDISALAIDPATGDLMIGLKGPNPAHTLLGPLFLCRDLKPGEETQCQLERTAMKVGETLDWFTTLPEAFGNGGSAAAVTAAQLNIPEGIDGEFAAEADTGAAELALPLYADAERDENDAFIFLPLVRLDD